MSHSKAFDRLRRGVLYVLPVPRFFSQFGGAGGHIAHFYGMVHGLIRAGYTLDILSEESPPSSIVPSCKLHVRAMKSRFVGEHLYWRWCLQREASRFANLYHPDFIYVRYSTRFAPWIPVLKARLRQIPLVLEVNSVAAQRYAWLKWAEVGALRAADVVICVSDTLREQLLQLFGPRLRKRILVLPNAVDVERFAQATPAPLGITAAGTHIGFAGTLKPDCGIETLIDAFIQVHRNRPTVVLHVFGDGPQRSVLQRRAARCAGIHFHGSQPFVAMPHILKSLDLLIHTASSAQTAIDPIKIYEYMASGKPFIATRIPQVMSILGDDECGLTYSIGDATTLARHMIYLIDHPDRAKFLALRALHEVRTHHTWQQRVSRLMAHLAERGYGHV